MIRVRKAEVVKILKEFNGVTEVEVLVEEDEEKVKAKAVNYDDLTGKIESGDEVFLNTTAVFKNLGTGGSHFVMANSSNTYLDVEPEGHIMKLRYTPFQVKCLSVEEQENVYQDKFNNFESLEGLPVVVGTLHSMLPLAVVGIKKSSPDLKVVYIMTDGAALPLKFSRLVQQLKEKKLVDATITIGHAFGGDYEAVNIYTALIAAKEILDADVVVVSMGPGIVGTGTTFGFTGIEQGEIINAVNILGGQPIAIPRISFGDARNRHKGISHHTFTTLGKIALTPAIIALPLLENDKKEFIDSQIANSGLEEKHTLQYADGNLAFKALKEEYKMEVTTMGRTTDQDPDFFLAAGAAGAVAGSIAKKKKA